MQQDIQKFGSSVALGLGQQPGVIDVSRRRRRANRVRVLNGEIGDSGDHATDVRRVISVGQRNIAQPG